jgi:predicted TIM-barrel fold metal-dependent hydrolase
MGHEDVVAKLTAKYPNLYTDTSTRAAHFGTAGDWSFKEAAAWIRRIGVERVVYASNYPTADPIAAKANVESLGLTHSEARLVMSANAQRLMSRG